MKSIFQFLKTWFQKAARWLKKVIPFWRDTKEVVEEDKQDKVRPIQKYLFGTITTELKENKEQALSNPYPYKMTSNDWQGEKEEIREGMLYTLDLYPSYWATLPDTGNSLTELYWNDTPEATKFTIEFTESPLFDQFPGAITDYTAWLETVTDQEVMMEEKSGG